LLHLCISQNLLLMLVQRLLRPSARVNKIHEIGALNLVQPVDLHPYRVWVGFLLKN
jgi:hypothetical protein